MKDTLDSFGNATSAKIIVHTTTGVENRGEKITLGRLLTVKINRLHRKDGKKMRRLRGDLTIFLPNPKNPGKNESAKEEKFLKMLQTALRGLGLRTKMEDQPALHVIRRSKLTPREEFAAERASRKS